MRDFEKNWKFNINISFSLSVEDSEIMTLLYQPIIKKEAYIIYMNLYTLSSLQETEFFFNGDEYFKEIGFDSSQLLDGIRHLEGLKLLQTYQKEEIDSKNNISKRYLFKLLSPASSYKFFNDSLLRSLLIENVGERRYTRLKLHFKYSNNKDLISYSDISSSFSDVYSMPNSYLDIIDENDYGNKLYSKEEVIDTNKLVTRLNKENYSYKLKKDEIEKIVDTSNAFGIKLDDLVSIIKSATSSNNLNFYYDKFKYEAMNYNDFKSVTNIDLKKSNNSDAKYLKGIEYYNSFNSVEEFLALKMKKKPSKSQNNCIYKIKNEYKFHNVIIMIIIDYSIKKTDCFNEQYIEKVADSIKLNKLVNPYDVMEFLNNYSYKAKKARNKKQQLSNAGIKEIKPENIDTEKMSKKEIEDLF